MSKPIVENIYPLSSLQQAMLLHHLQASEDQGLLQVSCKVHGNLNVEILNQAWKEIIDRHEVLRSSLHHAKVEQPVQVVRAGVAAHVELVDGREWSEKELQQWSDLQRVDRLDFLKPPISRLSFVQLQDDEYLLMWLCHHILIDGWSTSIILREFFQAYSTIQKEEKPIWSEIPKHGDYLSWKKEKDDTALRAFWSDGFRHHIESAWLLNESVEPKFGNYEHILTSQLGTSLQELASSWQVSLNVVYQLAWTLFLAKQSSDLRVRYGLTVSGRSGDLEHFDRLVGLYMNVLPVIREIDVTKSLKEIAGELQMWLLGAVQFDHLSISEIAENLGEPDFVPETLFTFENLPWSPIDSDGIRVDTFSGGITSNYPLALVVIPASSPRMIFRYNEGIVSKDQVAVIGKALQDSMQDFCKDLSLKDVLGRMPVMSSSRLKSADISDGLQLEYTPPSNQTELNMTKLWEAVLRRQPIGIDQDFFALGGKSLDAIRLFTQIKEKFNKHLSPALLLQFSTIRQLATLVSDQDVAPSEWSSLVPLRAKGNKPPLFCIHAGGAHVFFYQALMQYLDPDQPVFGIQPSGLDGVSETESSIEEMAASYFKEIRELQPDGPYCLLGYCFSVPVCIEIDKLIREEQAGESLILVVDSGPWFDLDQPISMGERLNKLVTIARNRNWSRLGDIIEDKTKKVRSRYLKNIENKHAADLLAMENQLREIYQAYNWEPFGGKITLLRSREFADRADKEFHINEWKRLASAGLNVAVVEGEHKTLFEEPDVQQLAVAVQEKINELSSVRA